MNTQRVQAIRRELGAAKADAVVLTSSPVVRWASGLESSNALVYMDAGRAVLVTDSRYAEAARQEVRDFEVVIGHQADLATVLSRTLRDHRPPRLGFQAERTSMSEHEALQTAFPDRRLIPLVGFLQSAMAAKSAAEIAALTRAQAITDAVFTEVLPLLKPGVSERDIAAELVYRQLQHGADRIAPDFWPIVAFGERGALPHAHPSERKLGKNEAVLLDFGCIAEGYCSDMTRTVFIGTPPAEFRRAYAVVLDAQRAALAAARAGIAARKLDAVARERITKAGYGEYFGHGLGHGVGLEIHEFPVLNPRSHDTLPEHAAITVEPGVYLPGKFGIRIEDMIILQANGSRNLTASSKELITL